jgi:hypothetical protein
MSDLYHETSETGSAEAGTWDSGLDTSTGQEHETAEPAPGYGYESPAETGGYGEYYETQADTEARIADQDDELPSPAESRAATWGDSPEYYDETELGAEYDGDISAFIAEEDELPTPQESRARTWGDNPDFYDETDLASEYDGDLSSFTADDDSPYDGQEATPDTRGHPAADQHAQDDTSSADTLQQPVSPEVPESGRAMSEHDERDPDTVSVAVEHPVAGTDHATTEPEVQPSAEATPEEQKEASTGARISGEQPSEAADSSQANQEPDAERSPAGADRFTELGARHERLERDRQAEPGTEITGKDLSSGERAGVKEAKGHPRRWGLPSDARLNLGATVVAGGLSTAADYVADGAAHHAFGIAGVALSVGAGVIGVMRENRKSKNADRPED